MRSFSAFGLLCAFLPLLSASAGHAAGPVTGHGDAASCAALAGQTIGSDTQIQSAEYMPDGSTVGTTNVAIPFCRVVGAATPTSW